MSTNELDHIVDRIYEAAVIPEHWPHAFDAVAQRIEAALGSLFIWRAGKVDRWIGTPAAQQLIADYVALARPEFNSRAARCSNSGLGDFGFVTDHDLFQRDEIERDAFYREFLHPRGYA